MLEILEEQDGFEYFQKASINDEDLNELEDNVEIEYELPLEQNEDK